MVEAAQQVQVPSLQWAKVPEGLQEKFPAVKEDVKEYISCNLVGLMIEKAYDYILNTVIPKLQKQWKAEHNDDNDNDDDDNEDIPMKKHHCCFKDQCMMKMMKAFIAMIIVMIIVKMKKRLTSMLTQMLTQIMM